MKVGDLGLPSIVSHVSGSNATHPPTMLYLSYPRATDRVILNYPYPVDIPTPPTSPITPGRPKTMPDSLPAPYPPPHTPL